MATFLRGDIVSKRRKPLPDHTRLDYWECYAKITLEKLFHYNNLIVRDKPDLQAHDKSIGIEVTQAIDPHQIEAEKLYVKIVCNEIRDKEKATDTIEKLGCSLNGGVLFGKKSIDAFCLVLNALESKLKKLNGRGYAVFEDYGLFVFSDIYADEGMLKNALDSMNQIQKGQSIKFKWVMVSTCECFYLFNIATNTFEIIRISSDEQSDMAIRAFEMVNDEE